MEVYDKIAHSWHKFRNKPLDFVVDYLKQRSGTLLVAGMGSGRHANYAKSLGFDVYGFDSSKEMVKLAGRGNYVVADVRKIPFDDKSFDYGLCVAVLHHLKPEELYIALKELARVIKKDILISVWRYEQKRFEGKPQEQYIKWGKHNRYYYLYKIDEFKSKVSRFFKVEKDLSDKSNIVLICSPLS